MRYNICVETSTTDNPQRTSRRIKSQLIRMAASPEVKIHDKRKLFFQVKIRRGNKFCFAPDADNPLSASPHADFSYSPIV